MGSKFLVALTAIFIVGVTIVLPGKTVDSIWESADVLTGPQCRNDIFVSASSPTFSTEVGANQQVFSKFSPTSSPTLFLLSRAP